MHHVDQTIEKEVSDFISCERVGPRLKKFIDILLSIQPTSIDSERSFSICGMISTQRRLRLDAEKIETLLFLNQNI